MSTLIQNVGMLDARKATREKVAEITKIRNIGTLIFNPDNKDLFQKVSMENVGSSLELDDDYALQTGNIHITRGMLEAAKPPMKLCLVGNISFADDITPELIQEKITGLVAIGNIKITEVLHAVLMATAKQVIGQISSSVKGEKSMTGKVELTNQFLEKLNDQTPLSVVGKLIFAEDIDPSLYERKILSLCVVGVIIGDKEQKDLIHGKLTDSSEAKIKIISKDTHYLNGDGKLDAFTLMTIDKPIISAAGHLFIQPDITPEILKEKNVHFESNGVTYFPKALMMQMAKLISSTSKGIPYDQDMFVVITGEQNMTNVRLAALKDNTVLVNLGDLEFAADAALEQITLKIGILDNYGEIQASPDICSILQSKLRQNEGDISSEEHEEDEEQFDHVIQNAGIYQL